MPSSHSVVATGQVPACRENSTSGDTARLVGLFKPRRTTLSGNEAVAAASDANESAARRCMILNRLQVILGGCIRGRAKWAPSGSFILLVHGRLRRAGLMCYLSHAEQAD